ncbi:MAG: VWA domain-containing protein [Alphaproteobacteria bacterium]|nr:VWA domain-containing protein [Alphaproteobacteria bacterium]
MNHFVWAHILFLLPLPIIMRIILPASKNGRQESALKVPFFNKIQNMDNQFKGDKTRAGNYLVATLMYLAWFALVIAAARPQWVGSPIKTSSSGRDLMMAIDLSKSMAVNDFVLKNMQVDRLTAVKNVASKFIKKREGDRIGLVLFGERAYIQSPLTFDRKSIQIMLDESEIGLAGSRTAIGDAMGIVIKYLRKQEVGQKVLILLTDGASNAGAITPQQALQIAKEEGVKIYTIGVGADEMQVRGAFGGFRTVNPSKDLDEQTLINVAKTTGGKFFRAKNTKELLEIYKDIDKLEPTEGEAIFFRPKKELFYIPFAIFLVLSLMILLLTSSGAFSNSISHYISHYKKAISKGDKS